MVDLNVCVYLKLDGLWMLGALVVWNWLILKLCLMSGLCSNPKCGLSGWVKGIKWVSELMGAFVSVYVKRNINTEWDWSWSHFQCFGPR